jgi:hypothetical protein
MDYKLAIEEDNQTQIDAIREAWGNSIDFEAYMDMDISELQNKLDEAADQIEELTNKKYEIALSWDSIDQLE